jgi:hypothetical protein
MEHAHQEGPSASETPRSSQRRVLRALVWTLVGLVALVGFALVAVMVTGQLRSAAALDRLRASGAPVYPEDLRFAPSPNAASFDAWEQRGREVDEQFQQVEWEALPECAGFVAALVGTHDPEWDLQEDFRFAVTDPNRAGRLTDCHRAVHQAWLAETASTLAWVSTLEPSVRPDWPARLEPGSTFGGPFVRAPAWQTATVVPNALMVAMLDEAWSGRSEEAVQLCARVFELAHLYHQAPDLPTFLLLSHHEAVALDAFQALVLALPSGVDLRPIEAQFDATSASERFQFALEGQRALGNAFFCGIADGTLELLTEEWSERLDLLALRVLGRWLQSKDLEQYEQQFALLGRRYVDTKLLLERFADEDGTSNGRFFYGRTAVDDVRSLAHLETVRVLSKALLVAYRDGVDAASAWARAQPDPFGTGMLRARIDGDGVLTIWSVGANGSDDGAPLPPWAIEDWGPDRPPDPAIRFRPREVR